MSITKIGKTWENGVLVTRDEDGVVIDVDAPIKLIMSHAIGGGEATSFGNWRVSAVNSGTIVGGDPIVITSGAADDDDMDIASAVCFSADKGLTLEAKIANGDIDKSAFNIGFSDAIGEAVDLIAYTFDTITLTSTASDGAFIYTDSDASSNVFRAGTVDTNVESTAITTTTAPADGVYDTFKIVIDPAGLTTFWLNGVNIGTADTAVASDVKYCAYLGYITREAFVNTLSISHFAAWQWTR